MPEHSAPLVQRYVQESDTASYRKKGEAVAGPDLVWLITEREVA